MRLKSAAAYLAVVMVVSAGSAWAQTSPPVPLPSGSAYSPGVMTNTSPQIIDNHGFTPVPHVGASPPVAVFSETSSTPPGTIGKTYQRVSALVPKDEHPRAGMIDVHVSGYEKVVIIGLVDFEGFKGTDGVWHFTSEDPLLPHVPHIYQVIATNGPHSETSRWVRMIPGRIVTIQF